MSKSNLPTFEECEQAVKDNTATPLQQFIYDNEPNGKQETYRFRNAISAILKDYQTLVDASMSKVNDLKEDIRELRSEAVSREDSMSHVVTSEINAQEKITRLEEELQQTQQKLKGATELLEVREKQLWGDNIYTEEEAELIRQANVNNTYVPVEDFWGDTVEKAAKTNSGDILSYREIIDTKEQVISLENALVAHINHARQTKNTLDVEIAQLKKDFYETSEKLLMVTKEKEAAITENKKLEEQKARKLTVYGESYHTDLLKKEIDPMIKAGKVLARYAVWAKNIIGMDSETLKAITLFESKKV